MDEPLQAGLARFISRCDYNKIAEKFVDDAKLRVLDWIGCAVAGGGYPQTRMARQLMSVAGWNPQAFALGMPFDVPARSAAFINGIAGHVCELDDGHRTAIGHPGSVTVPVAFALGQAQDSTGKDFLKVVILGYDVFTRLGRMVNPTHYRCWHTTGTVGTFAAAAAASSLLKLTPDEVNNALGLATTMNGGLVESFGSHAKALNIAEACQNGIDAALLAKMGFTGSHSAIMGPKGFIAATCTDPHPENLENPSEETLVSDTAFFKKYSSCGHTNSPLDGLCALMKAHPDIKPEAVEKITVRTYRVAVDITSKLKAATEDEAKFSLPYCFAVQLMFGSVGLKQFAESIRKSPEVLALAKLVKVDEDPEATAAFPKRQATVEITLKDGTTFVEKRLGSSDDADLALVENKFESAAAMMDKDALKEIEQIVLHLEDYPNILPLVAQLKTLKFKD